MSQLRVNSIATTAGSVNMSLSANGFSSDNKVIMAGQMGSFSSITGAQKVPFNDFWVQRGISYSSDTRRFTVPVNGIYRVTLNTFQLTGQGGTRVMIGINNDAPSAGNHRGHAYGGDANYQILHLESVIPLSANDYIVFYLSAGGVYNSTDDRFNQFTIERIA
jgi:hypothetical protein